MRVLAKLFIGANQMHLWPQLVGIIELLPRSEVNLVSHQKAL
jgi:hypothetical protein